MKISKDLNALTTTQTEMAKVIGITQQRVNQLISEGVILKDKTGAVRVIESIKNFYKSRSGSNALFEEIDYDGEKAKHEAVKRELAEMELARQKNLIHDADDVEQVMSNMLSTLRSNLLGMPAKVAPLLEKQSKDYIFKHLTAEIESRLMELSDYSPELFKDVGDDDASEDG